jgi:voltage-gated potassium channel
LSLREIIVDAGHEYILRMLCVPSKRQYATSFFGIIDLLSILPTYLGIFARGMSYLKVIRILRVLRVFRILKLGNHTRQADLLRNALYASRAKIMVFLCFVMTLVVIIGALMYSIEGTLEETETEFTSIPKSIYWAIVTLTTVGYGDISPQTGPGQCLAAIVMLMGYSIIAVPTGIVTAQIIQTPKKAQNCANCDYSQHDPDANFCKKCGSQLNQQEAG